MTESSSSMTIVATNGCGCAACMSGNEGVTLFNSDDVVGGDVGAPSTVGTKEEFGSYLTDGYWQDAYSQYGPSWSSANFEGWSSTNLTFSIGNWYSAAEKAGIRDAFDQWSDVTNLNFTEVGSGGDIYFDAPNGGDDSGRAYASVGWSLLGGTATINGPVRVMIDYDSGSFGSDPSDLGNYALMTAIHEIGHAIGLGHSGYYNAGQGNPTYATDGQWTNDTRQYSLMSYWQASNSGANHLGEYASTPLVMDIYAIQSLYGANNSTRSGNTTYGFNSNAGRDQFDFTVNVEPVVAIWDGGGTDTLDLSGFSNTQMINLADGSFSNVGGGTGNLAIAYGAIIENAVGGSGADTIYGNDANNIINGGNGGDTMYGSAGSDTLDGDGGTDTVNYSFDLSDFLVSLVNSVTLTLQHLTDGWTDTIRDVENFIFNGTGYTFAEVSAEAYEPESYDMIFKDSGTKYYYTSSEHDTITAEELGFGGASGNLYNIVRNAEVGFEMTVLSNDAPAGMNLYGGGNGDIMTVKGAHTGFNIYYNGYAGDDTLSIGTYVVGDDTLYGGDGNDTISASAGNDYLRGDAGNDTLNGGDGNDSLLGGTGDDTLNGDAGDDYMLGDDGIDILNGGTGHDRLYGGSDNDTLNGGAGLDKLYGDAGNDTINGGDDRDIVSGGDGDDTINGDAGNDVLYGNAGEDTLNGGTGNDGIYGGNDDDTINGGDGIDYLYGESGDDTINGDAGGDIIFGAAGLDVINGGDGADTVYGGNDNDTINGGDDGDSLAGEYGNDTIHGDAGDDYVYGGAGNDYLYGDEGIDRLYGGIGNDNIWGGIGNDIISGEDGIDTLRGEDGDDSIYGGAGNDSIYGGAGNDQVYAGNDDDTVHGGDGNDGLRGENGNDTIYGNDGTDYIYGQAGDDTIYGGEGLDVIYGGDGADTFVFEVIGMDGTIDYVKDFDLGEGDALNIADLLTGFVDGVSDINDFVQFGSPNGKGEVSFGVDRDGTGGTHSLTWIAKLSTGGAALDADTLYGNGDIIVA